MIYTIRDLRDMTGFTQKGFAALYGIPLSTLRKWEQGEASPAPYVLSLLARSLPGTNKTLRAIHSPEGETFFYDPCRQMVLDSKGNGIMVHADIDQVKEQNLVLYLQELFSDYYRIQERFDRDCRLDKEEGILWTK